jgi:cysteine desulfurase
LDLDAASTTPVAKEVMTAMDPYFSDIYFNPSSPHLAGQLVSKKLLDSRKEIADYFSVTSEDIIFTTSATEANNWIIEDYSQIVLPNKEKPHIIYSVIEHDSVIAPILKMEQRGLINTTILPVDNNGLINIYDLEKALTPNTVLVSIMGVNNETGILEPLNLIGQCLEKFRKQNKSNYPYFHSDGVQALNYFSWSNLKGIDVLTLSGHKIYGPKGIGGLVFLNHRALKIMNPLTVGGHQEFNLRAGTENIPSVIGLAKALNLLGKTSLNDKKYLLKLQSLFWLTLQKENKNIQLNGNLNFSAH